MRVQGHVVLIIILATILVLQSGCRRKQIEKVEEWKPGSQPMAAPRAITTQDTEPEQRGMPEAEHQESGLAHGTHMVFGIRLPRGMLPMDTQDKVKRFEGTHSIDAVKAYIVKQLAGKVEVRPNRFGEGVFISQAIPASSQRDLTNVDMSARKYNIKIFDGSLGGAGVEIWEATEDEAPQTASSSRSHGGATLNNLRGPTGAANKKGPVPKVKYETSRQKERATFDVFEKMSKGKPLTDADYQSPFFTEI